jgi:NhaA family Na+:H+ antiporter
LGVATLGFGLIVVLNLMGVRRVPIYVVVGTAIWFAFLKSGIHPTVAGVVLGLLTPARAWIGDRAILELASEVVHRLRNERDGVVEHYHKPLVGELRTAARETISPLQRLETALHPWVAFGIMPVFAIANAGVVVKVAALGDPVALAAATGLIIGKPLGVMLFSWLGIRMGLARLPAGVNWKAMFGAACLSGIGFTMSLFIGNLALRGDLLDAAKVGVMAGSAVSAIAGCLLLSAVLRKPAADGPEPT